MLMIVEVYEPQRVTFPLRLVRLFPITRQKYKIFLNYTGFVCFLGGCTLLRSMSIVRSVPVPMWTMKPVPIGRAPFATSLPRWLDLARCRKI